MDTVRSCHCHFPLTYLRSGVRGAGELCFEAWGAINHDLPVKTDGASIETFTVDAASSKKKPLDQWKKLHTYYIIVYIYIYILLLSLLLLYNTIHIYIYIYQYTSDFPQSPNRFDQYVDCTTSRHVGSHVGHELTWRCVMTYDLWAKLEDTLPVFSSYHNFRWFSHHPPILSINHDLTIIVFNIKMASTKNGYVWLFLVGGWPTPLKNDGVRQLGLLFPTEWKVIKFHGSKPPHSSLYVYQRVHTMLGRANFMLGHLRVISKTPHECYVWLCLKL